MVKDRIKIIKGDITTIKCDAIVNAANKHLMPGGGVDGAIHSAGGPEILSGCRKYISRYEELPTGECMLSSAGRLPAKAVIHTVGPKVFGDVSKVDEELLCSAYRNVLHLAVEEGFKTIAFPNISTGIYGFPKGPASVIAFGEVVLFLRQHPMITTVYFVCHDDENYRLYTDLLEELAI